MSEAAPARMLDVAFALEADGEPSVPRDHRRALAAALEDALPWLVQRGDDAPEAGVHGLKLSISAGPQALLSHRTRLVLRVPRERARDALALQGCEVHLGHARLRVGSAQPRELLPWGTVYAHCVAAGDADEAAFLRTVQAALDALEVPGRAICGRAQALEAGTLRGFSLMVDGLSAEQALQLMDAGLGAHRRLGCGLFVPHKSAAAVGAPS